MDLIIQSLPKRSIFMACSKFQTTGGFSRLAMDQFLGTDPTVGSSAQLISTYLKSWTIQTSKNMPAKTVHVLSQIYLFTTATSWNFSIFHSGKKPLINLEVFSLAGINQNEHLYPKNTHTHLIDTSLSAPASRPSGVDRSQSHWWPKTPEISCDELRAPWASQLGFIFGRGEVGEVGS